MMKEIIEPDQMMKEIMLEILRTLKRCGKYMLPESRLLDAVRIGVRPEPLTLETREALRALETRGMIIAGRSALDYEPQWKLTTAGAAALAENE